MVLWGVLRKVLRGKRKFVFFCPFCRYLLRNKGEEEEREREKIIREGVREQVLFRFFGLFVDALGHIGVEL